MPPAIQIMVKRSRALQMSKKFRIHFFLFKGDTHSKVRPFYTLCHLLDDLHNNEHDVSVKCIKGKVHRDFVISVFSLKKTLPGLIRHA